MAKSAEFNHQTDNPYKLFAQIHHNKRTPAMEILGVPSAFVVDGRQKDDFWSLIPGSAYPLKIGGFNPWARRKAGKYMEKFKRKYKDDILVVIVRDAEIIGSGGWSGGAILKADLQKKPDQLLKEGMEASQHGDFYLHEMKRRAYMAVTGYTDTK